MLLGWFLSTIPRQIVNAAKSFKEGYSDTGIIGDTFGGLLGPPIAFLAAILTFLAFWVQYEANKQQRHDIKQQREDWQLERLETRFFELLKLHKENVSEIEFRNKQGKFAFGELFDNFEKIYDTVNRTYKAVGAPPVVNPAYIAYLIFFFGLGFKEEKSYVPDLTSGEKDFFDATKKALTPEVYYMDSYRIPYDGVFVILASYYRQLYQVTKYVTDYKLLEPADKYQYIRTLRGQMSEQEQLMLYLNGSILFPDKWEELFTEYRLIKNIPLENCEGELSPILKYGYAMARLWITSRKRLFQQQGDISAIVSFWITKFPEEFLNLKIHM
jgi:hypothetical protein